MPFRECSYIKEDMEDSADLFTEEIAVEEDTNQVDKNLLMMLLQMNNIHLDYIKKI